MNYIPVIFFGIAAVGGLTLAALYFTGKELPLPVAIIHGLLAATGIVTLFIYVSGNMDNLMLKLSLTLFLIAAIGGFTLFSYDIRKKQLPGVLIPVHGIAAVIAYLILLIGIFR